MSKPIKILIPLVIIAYTVAWLLHGLSEWSYDAAAKIYKMLGTDILSASINWEK